MNFIPGSLRQRGVSVVTVLQNRADFFRPPERGVHAASIFFARKIPDILKRPLLVKIEAA